MKERDTWVELHGRRHAALGHERAACPAILANFLRDMVLYPDHDTLGWALAHYGTDEWLIENREFTKGKEIRHYLAIVRR